MCFRRLKNLQLLYSATVFFFSSVTILILYLNLLLPSIIEFPMSKNNFDESPSFQETTAHALDEFLGHLNVIMHIKKTWISNLIYTKEA